MSYNEFEDSFYSLISPFRGRLREGQRLMNYLFEIWPEEYIRITNKEYVEDVDCFYKDYILYATMNHLRNVWNNFGT